MLRLLPFAAALTSGAQARRHKYNTNAQRTNAPGVLNVHVISHTHDDVGWLKTVDEYYAGLNNTIQVSCLGSRLLRSYFAHIAPRILSPLPVCVHVEIRELHGGASRAIPGKISQDPCLSLQHAGVRHILDSTMDSLAKNPDRKFIYVEQAFFQRWYAEQDEEQKAQVQKFVEQGRLSFVNGGWCMHDEATTSYVDMVDQTQLGHRFIVSEFGQAALPSVTWQIDPFGHSGTQASLLSSPASGYSALFVSRADYADIQARTKTKSLEYIWQASNSLGSQASTFFSIMNLGLHLYFPLPGLCWDALNCNDPEVQDDPELDDYNVDSVVATTVNSAQSLAASYVGDVYLTQGFDFNYEYAEEWFINIDKMIHYVNLNTSIHGVNMFYSTPQEYARAKLAYPVTWPSKVNDDGFPYADGPHSYWTGFFSSRQALKGYVRDTSSYFQAAKQIQAIAKPMYDLDPSNPLYTLMRAMGVAQHHDAVAGTEQQHVAFDYAKRLARGRLASDAFLMNSIPSLLGLEGVEALTCDLANATICPALESLAPAVVFVYNSQAQAKGALPIRIPVGTGSGAQSWAVYLGHPSQGKSVQAQLLPLSAADTDLRANYYSYTGNAPSTSWLAFQAPVPAVGLAAFVIVPSASIGDEHVSQPVSVNAADQTLTNGLVTLTISVTTGQLSHVSVPSLGVNADMTMDWLWYNASVGNADDGQASGAYIFRPNSSTPLSVIPQGFTPTTTIVSGPVVSEARQVIAPWVTAVIRLWAGRTDWDIEYTVGPVPFSDGLGKEIVVRYNVPSLQTNGTCYTDSNGRDLYKRVRNYRPSWNATIHEPVAGNYYPVNAGMLASDVASGMTLWVANDRSQGGGSIVDGSVELMVQRRLQADDQRGVSQPLNETGLTGAGLVVRGVHRVGVNPSTNAIAALRAAMQDVALFRPLITYGGVPAAIPVANVSALSAPLPPNVHLLTLQSLSDKVLMLRVAHLFGVGEVAVLSSNATVDLATMFKDRTFSDCSEYTLPGGQPLASVAPVHYQVEGQGTVRAPATPQDAEQKVTEGGSRKRLTAMPVTLSPLQVRTFQCTVQ